jgi:uncharacterized protein YceK
MKIISLLFICALFAGCSTVSHTNSNPAGATTSATAERPQYHAHTVTDYTSDGATTFLEMSPDDDANNR